MGIKLSELVPKRSLDFADLTHKKIAVDSSNMLYQFLSSIRQADGTPLMDSRGNITSHLMGILTRVTNLMQRDIKLAFVFDGKPPALKFRTQQDRNSIKESAEEKRRQAEEDNDVSEQLKFAKQTTRLTMEMCEESKELLLALGLPVIQAKSEAEAQAAFLCKRGSVWAVASSDFDNLVYGAPRMIQSLTLSDKRRTPSGYVMITPSIIYLQDLLKELDLTQEQLLTLAILVGTDYNPGGVKGIGPKKALKLVKENATPEEVFKKIPIEFDWKEIRDTFRNMPVEDVDLEWKPINEKKVYKILVDDYNFNAERVQKVLEKLTKKGSDQRTLGDF